MRKTTGNIDYSGSVSAICDDAIADSIRFDEIVTIDGGQEECDYLEAGCEASVENSYITEFWGTLNGDDWRVHVDRFDAENEVDA